MLNTNESEFKKRLISSIIVVLITTFSVVIGGIISIVFFSLCFTCAISEYYNICLRICKIKKKKWVFYNEPESEPIKYERTLYNPKFFLIFSIGGFYIFVSFYHLYLLSIFIYPAFYVMGVSWSTDTFAYIGGKIIQGKKLCPSISPGKTISGFITGIISAGIFSVIVRNFSSFGEFLFILFQGVILGVISQYGDIIESYLKRKAHLKNSGNLIPGHGGILDRVDGVMAISLFIMIITVLFSDL